MNLNEEGFQEYILKKSEEVYKNFCNQLETEVKNCESAIQSQATVVAFQTASLQILVNTMYTLTSNTEGASISKVYEMVKDELEDYLEQALLGQRDKKIINAKFGNGANNNKE